MKKLIIGITAPSSVILLKGQLKYFNEKGYDCYLLAPKYERTLSFCKKEGCTLLPVNIKREISPMYDLMALLAIIIHFTKVKPDVINVGTPKMGLLGSLAGWLTGINNRIYTCRGYRFEHEKGFLKKLLLFMEKMASAAAHEIICISDSVRELGLKHKLFTPDKAVVVNKGSSNGIDIGRFNPDNVSDQEKNKLIEKLNVNNAFVYGYVGRLVDRKGINELYEAFVNLKDRYDTIKLIVVGPVERNQISDLSIIKKMEDHPDIIMTGKQLNVPLYLSIMDVFVLPAWWEGFGNVLVEAAAMNVPVLSTTGTGSRDAVNDGFNGLLVPAKQVEPLTKAMERLYNDDELRAKLGSNGRVWAKNFDSEIIWQGMHELYSK